ncbi:DUF7563 family protein [Halomicrococcus sp. SG-WS-1]|uniref:DUF7563 family protein n=1 Tax=Halomicrococcus sp. SG-WS-1 TaxID=3439057 RepID=UPI003F7952A5
MSMDITGSHETEDSAMADTQCRNCDAFVTPQFARVFGNNRNEVYGCFECMTATEVKKGRANHPEEAERAREELRR